MFSLRLNRTPLIFVVEDEPFYQKLIQANLGKFNFTNIKTFLSGEECLSNMSDNPDFIILDYNLGGISGLDVLEEVKSNNPETHVIFLSASREVELANLTMEKGADSFIVKNNQSFNKIKQRIHNLSSFNKLKKVKQITRFFLLAIAGIAATTIILNHFYPHWF